MRAACHSSYARQCEKYIPSKFEENQNTLGAHEQQQQQKLEGNAKQTKLTSEQQTRTLTHSRAQIERNRRKDCLCIRL